MGRKIKNKKFLAQLAINAYLEETFGNKTQSEVQAIFDAMKWQEEVSFVHHCIGTLTVTNCSLTAWDAAEKINLVLQNDYELGAFARITNELFKPENVI